MSTGWVKPKCFVLKYVVQIVTSSLKLFKWIVKKKSHLKKFPSDKSDKKFQKKALQFTLKRPISNSTESLIRSFIYSLLNCLWKSLNLV
jgi:hypothetical protein